MLVYQTSLIEVVSKVSSSSSSSLLSLVMFSCDEFRAKLEVLVFVVFRQVFVCPGVDLN